jgi:hypothetical protein
MDREITAVRINVISNLASTSSINGSINPRRTPVDQHHEGFDYVRRQSIHGRVMLTWID